MLSYSAQTDASPDAVWALMARPDRWSEWAPHVRGAWGLGSPEVRAGASGAVRLMGVVPVPAKILETADGRSWRWRVGPVELDHRVAPLPRGALVSIHLFAPGPLESALGATYGPLVGVLVRRLARVAERS